MRKMKKINGYLVVKFNARELREYEGTALGEYGVIDAELYTGILDVDRGAMEYDNAGSMEEAVELARGLESELDAEEPEVKVTIVKETDETTEEEEVDAQQMIAGWENTLRGQVASPHYKDVDARTAAHELYGYKAALRDLGLLAREDCFVLPDTFGAWPGREERTTFEHLHPELKRHRETAQLYALGLALAADCPPNDCRVYLNIFDGARELDAALDNLDADGPGGGRRPRPRQACENARDDDEDGPHDVELTHTPSSFIFRSASSRYARCSAVITWALKVLPKYSKNSLPSTTPLLLEVADQSPKLRHHREAGRVHVVDKSVPGFQLGRVKERHIIHFIHPLPGPGALLRLYQRRGGAHKEETAA